MSHDGTAELSPNDAREQFLKQQDANRIAKRARRDAKKARRERANEQTLPPTAGGPDFASAGRIIANGPRGFVVELADGALAFFAVETRVSRKSAYGAKLIIESERVVRVGVNVTRENAHQLVRRFSLDDGHAAGVTAKQILGRAFQQLTMPGRMRAPPAPFTGRRKGGARGRG